MSTPAAQPNLVGASLQVSVDRFASALNTPSRLLRLAPTKAGHPGNAAALSPAIVLTTIAAFEGFAEEFVATVLALQGAGLAQIADAVGRWNNPTLADFAGKLKPHLSLPAQSRLSSGPAAKIRTYATNTSGNWSLAGRAWAGIEDDAESWMQARHLLTHGLVSGWRAERWPPPIKASKRPASAALRPKPGGLFSLDRSCAKSCARVYTYGGQHIAAVAAADLGQSLAWNTLPSFD